MSNYPKLHGWLVVIVSMLTAGCAAGVVSFPQYAAPLTTAGAMLLALSKVITQNARNADPPQKPPSIPPAAGTGILMLVLLLTGCSSFMHFSDPTLEDIAAKICGEAVDQHKAELQAQADKAGIPL